jgi:Dolichyl-phosphate-mannose-protein mannosyltransferase
MDRHSGFAPDFFSYVYGLNGNLLSNRTQPNATMRLPTAAPFFERADRVAKGFESLIEEHHVTALSAIFLWIGVCSWAASRVKPFWLDEYLTYHTALMTSPAAIWGLQTSVPMALDPPGFHWLTYFSLRLFGDGDFSARLPSVLAYLAFSGCLFTLVRRCADGLTALLAVFLAMSSGLFYYACECRPYSLVVAAGAGALLAWSYSGESKKRLPSLIALAACGGLAFSAHYFGFLVLIPIGIGEIYRWFIRKQISPGVPVALIAGASVALMYIPLMPPLRRFQVHYWTGAGLETILKAYGLLLSPLAFLIAGLLMLSLLAGTASLAGARLLVRPMPARPDLVAAVFAFTLLPLFGFAIGRFVTHTFVARFALPAGIGIVLAVTFALRGMLRRQTALLALAALIAAAPPVMQIVYDTFRFARFQPNSDSGPAADAGLPIVISSLEQSFALARLSSPSVRQRLVFLTDPAQVRIAGNQTEALTVESIIACGTTHMNVRRYSEFVRANPRFLMAGSLHGGFEWVGQKILEDSGDMSLKGTYAGADLFLVTMPPPGN